jgi:ribonuclease G
MAGNSILVINAAGAETRVALVESGTIHEYYLERKREKGIVGNIYKGKVVRVLPGMQAAFVDIGLEKAAFLYVGDVYGDPDFSEEFELTEGEHRAEVPEVPDELEAEAEEARAQAAGPADVASTITPVPTLTPIPDPASGASAPEGASPEAAPPPAAAPEPTPAEPPPAPLTAIPLTNEIGMAPVPAVPGLMVPPLADAEPDASVEAPAAAESAPAAESSPAAAPPPAAEAPVSDRREVRDREAAREARPERADRERRRDRDERGRREGRDRDRDRGGRNGRDEKRSKEPKSIQDLLKEGQEVIVQVAKDPIGTKGARITSHISLPGRHLVFMPTVDHIGISRRIEKDAERRRLRDIVDRMRPEGTGFIVRTVAENVEAPKLEADIRFLIQVWNEIIRTKDKVSAPAQLHGDLDLILRATRDLFTAEVGKLVIDDREEYERILRFVHDQAPHLESQIELYAGDEPIFDAYGIEQELKRASQRKVWLKSGGYIIMDQAEALTAIDVNSGRYVGKKNLEETITRINVEASKEIVYQLRLRNIGGIIIIDFIDMDKPQNREKVFKALQDALGRDKAKTNVLKISELGLVEMTRKRVRESVTRMMNEPCGYCDGKGHLKSKITIAYEIFRDIRRESIHFPEPVLVVNCHPEVARILQGAERDELRYLMDRFNKTIQVKPQQNYHQEQFDLYGRQERTDQGSRGDRGRGGRDRGAGAKRADEQPAPAAAQAAKDEG